MPGTGDCAFAVLQQVTIKQVDQTKVSFAARSASLSGDTNECLLRVFTVPLSEVYTAPIPGAPPPVAMTPGATGNLFLSRAGWATTTPDGFGLFGALQASFKWPECAGVTTRFATKLTVVPRSIVIRGHLQGQGEPRFFDLELLGPDAAESQDLVWTGAEFLEVRLTPQGARRLLGHAPSSIAKIWPTRIVIQGSPAIDQAVSGEVDILDSEVAEGVQHLAFGRHGAPISLTLTQDGVNAFHVTPQAVAERSGAAVTASGQDHAGHRVAGVIRRQPRR